MDFLHNGQVSRASNIHTSHTVKTFSKKYLFCETSRKIYWNFKVHTIPVSFQENTELLSTAQCKHGYQNLTQHVYANTSATFYKLLFKYTTNHCNEESILLAWTLVTADI